MTNQTPKELGFYMPAEWHAHEATWMSWPNPTGISFPGSYSKILPTLGEMINTISESETLRLNVSNLEMEKLAKKYIAPSALKNVEFYTIPTNEPWCRDHGPVFVIHPETREVRLIDFEFNAWGGKYRPWDSDNSVPSKIAEIFTIQKWNPKIILEGGSIDTNGKGTLLTTESCLLNPNRNPKLTREQIEQYLKDYINVRNIIWLGDGIDGDDTDGHVDDLTRFVDEKTIVTVVEENPEDENHKPLKENLEKLKAARLENGEPFTIIELPMPRKIEREDLRLPASYANFYITNNSVLLPVFQDLNDQKAVEILQQCFPTRKVVPIDSLELIWGLGSFHCLTQQQPKA